MKWLTSEHDPDLYDARMRDWYIKAAASPKEIVILLDTSGSMTGLRKEIAKHVVLNILQTLSEDDFVTIYKFSKHPTPLVECFTTEDGRAELVQVSFHIVILIVAHNLECEGCAAAPRSSRSCFISFQFFTSHISKAKARHVSI